jgi:hypothetical protein
MILFFFQNILQVQAYHIDGLISLSDVFRMSEDMQMSAELLGNKRYNENCVNQTLNKLESCIN